MAKLFGTDGVRGLANSELTPELAMQIGRAGAFVLSKQSSTPKVLIGTDTRRSADMLEAALTAGLCSVGAEVYLAGVIPSPAMAYLVRKYKMDAGIMLSASHNPMPDNGIKFFDSEGFKLSDALEEEIESLYESGGDSIPRPTGRTLGRSYKCETVVKDYVDFLVSTLPFDGDKKPLCNLKIALDCANGATYQAAPQVFGQLGAEIELIHFEPDGNNINENCGSTHLESLKKFVKAGGFDVGLAFDGDGDRVLCIDDKGDELDGDAIMAICGQALKQNGKLKHDTIVATVMSNMGLQLMCKKSNITLHQTAVGDRYVIEKMREGGYVIGGEQSGHIIFSEFNTTGDGILSGLQLLSVINSGTKQLSELRQIMEHLPQVLCGAKVDNKHKYTYKENPTIMDAITNLEHKLAGEGRVLVRPSGTEPLVRVMIEGRDQASLDKWATELAALIEKELG